MSPDQLSIGGTNGGGPASADAEVARILDDYLISLEMGRPADPDRLLAEYPAFADQLRGCLKVIELAGRVSDGHGGIGAGLDPGPWLADYRIVRQVGRGGMGIVYEAEQQSLRRRVALKVLPMASALNPQQLRRFQVEAQAAAQLHHTHIVPVHAVGCERGVHFYAMQYIEGKSLAELIGELRRFEQATAEDATLEIRDDTGPLAPERPAPSSPSRIGLLAGTSARSAAYFRTVADLGVQAAEALEHAHQEGVIHRDIKPDNLMVDVKGHLWITDFGLARLQNDPGLTMSGDLVGTVRYMSPEQAIGRRVAVDPRMDIYAMGVTLYEMVALRPAFDGSDRREVLRRIIEQGPRPLRTINPAVPRPLETIIHKAMAREPSARYATAQELADDLRRFLDNRPIRARRPTLLECATTWTRRHRAKVASGALALVLAVAALTVAAVLIVREQRATAAALAQARAERQRAEQSLGRVLGGVARLVKMLQDERLSDSAARLALRSELSDHATRLIEGFVRDGSSDPILRMETIDAHLHLTYVHAVRHRPEAAIAEFRRAIAEAERLVADFPDQATYRAQLAQACNLLGYELWEAGRLQEARAEFAQAAGAYRRAAELEPENPTALWLAADFLVLCPEVAFRAPARAVELARRALAAEPGRAGILRTLGLALYRVGDWDGAIAATRESCRAGGGGDALDWFVLAMALWRHGDGDEARLWYSRGAAWVALHEPGDHDRPRLQAEAAALLGLGEAARVARIVP